jgi:hypothetical protein
MDTDSKTASSKVVERLKYARQVRRMVALYRQAKGSWDDKFIGQNARLQWSRHTWLLEELPQKGKKKLRSATLRNPSEYGYLDMWIPGNILMFAKLSSSDDYNDIKKKIISAYAEAYERTQNGKNEKDKEHLAKSDWVKEIVWYENEVFYLNVVPEGVEPFTVEGKDFSVKVSWENFKSYSPNSDLHQADPFYTYYEASSPTAARKCYLLLKADPNALKSVTWNNFGDWLNKQKILYKSRSSSWH